MQHQWLERARGRARHGVQVLAQLRNELFRILLLQSVDFYDATSTAELTGLLSTELDGLRSFLLSNVSRDRGLRAILEASGSVRPPLVCMLTCLACMHGQLCCSAA